MFKVIYLKNFRKGLATNSSSTHSLIYRNKDEMFEDLNIFGVDFFGRHTENIAATKEAKIKYVFHAIWWDDDLVRIMSAFYPQMKEYYDLAKNYKEYGDFGMYARGPMSTDNTLFSVDYLRHIIESEDIIIVGGSDEADFVYDTIEGHKQVPLPDDVYEWGTIAMDKNAPIKNGNYYVAYKNGNDFDSRNAFKYCSCGRLRFMTEEGDPVPEYPELIDLRITNKCEHGCKFCFMNSNPNQPDADINELEIMIRDLHTRTEFSIGGGNILLYPELERLFKALKNGNHIVNTTINVKDCDRILNDGKLRNLFIEYVDGIGVSVFNAEDAEKFLEFEEGMRYDESSYSRNKMKYCVMHLVPEYLGFETTRKILNAVQHKWTHVLFLGYKETGRGAKCKHHKFSKSELQDLIAKRFMQLAVDTQFAKTYRDFIDETFETTEYTLTPNEGEYSMYVDGITMNAYKSSYETDKPYFIGHELSKNWQDRRKDSFGFIEAFNNIRKDCGFPVFERKRFWEGQ